MKFIIHQTLCMLQVVDGYQVVKAMEAVGSSGGDTAFDVIIAHCGKADGAGTLVLHSDVAPPDSTYRSYKSL